MTPIEQFEAVIVGSGQGSKPLAIDLARHGWKTALIERDEVGGTCVNRGCTPTKTMVASARVAWLAREAARYGVRVGPARVDLAVVHERKQRIVESFRGIVEHKVTSEPGLELIRGEGSFYDAQTIEVRLPGGGVRRLGSPRIVLNTGCRPATPDLPGIERVAWLDSTSIMELSDIPEHLVILGGGYIGVEFGQMFRRFGSRVTIVQHAARLLAREDEDVAEEVASILTGEGVELWFDSKAIGVAPAGAGRLALAVTRAGQTETIEGSHLLFGIGRTPNTERLNLAAAGLEPDRRGFIPVNERLETAVPGIYAIGDVNGGPQFTHISYDDYRILRANLIGAGSATTANRPVPYTVFIDPQLGRIGLTEAQARALGRPIAVRKIPMTYVARALEVDETRGFMKAIVDVESDLILGAAILGLEGGEIASMIQLAMQGGLTATQLYNGVFSHPTLSEALNTLFTP